MAGDDWERAKQVFHRAIEKIGPQRDAFVASACGEDRDLRGRVEALLAAHEEAGGFLASPTSPDPEGADLVEATGSRTPLEEQPGTTIGPYRLRKVLGEGGFGVVYLAEQERPIRRRVALKVIKLGMDTKQVIARFEAERQALALMEHPNIARVLDVGTTETGRPYFVMELVDGVPITEYCDENRLGVRARLDLFSAVCRAVQHAHQKGVIHRDIKPSNALVTSHEGLPMPKVIDFGVSKAMDQRLTEKTLFTAEGQFIGTPVYMSPEQAGMGSLNVDTRSDVYSLGVLLYELLTGTTPFDVEVLRRAGYGEIQRIIREDEPPRPSTRVSTPGEASTASARARRTEPRALQRELSGDLDWITMRALEKDRSRRYSSPMELAEDIARHLCHEPVLARPPNTSYLIAKAVRRNKLLIGSLTVIFAVLALGVAMSTAFALRAVAQRRAAEQARADLEQVVRFQAGMVQEIGPEETGRLMLTDLRERIGRAQRDRGDSAEEVAARLVYFDSLTDGVNVTDAALRLIDERILDRAARSIAVEFKAQPLVEVQLRGTIGETYMDLGMYDRAQQQLRAALATSERFLGSDHIQTLSSISRMGTLLFYRGQLREAESYLRKALGARRRVQGEDHPDTLGSIHDMGMLLCGQNRLDEATPYVREALEGNRRVLGNDHPQTLASIMGMGWLLQLQGKLDDAERFYREALERNRRVLGSEHPQTLLSVNNMGALLHAKGDLAEAEVYYREALAAHRRILGDFNPATLTSIRTLGDLLRDRGRLAEAERFYRELLAGARRALGEEHPDTLASIRGMGDLLRTEGKLIEAESYCREALEGFRRVLGDDHPHTVASINSMGLLLQDQGKLGEAEPLLLEASERSRRVLGAEHAHTARILYSLACLESQRGRPAKALEWLRQAVDAGYADTGQMVQDSNLQPLFGDPAFDALVQRSRHNDSERRAD